MGARAMRPAPLTGGDRPRLLAQLRVGRGVSGVAFRSRYGPGFHRPRLSAPRHRAYSSPSST